MRIGSTLAAGTLVAISAVSLIACGSADDSAFGDESSTNGTNPADQGAFDTTGTNGSATGLDPVSAVGNKCAGTSAGLNGLPLHLVLVLDKSGSMKDRIGGSADSKWAQAKAALKEFFASPQSAGITVDLVPFPFGGDTCSAAGYSTATSSGELPGGAGTLSGAIDKLSPSGGTPTNPALTGAITYAKGLQKSLAGQANVSIILATDGEPKDCVSNSISDVASTVAGVKDSLKTYVIGLGDNLTNLNSIAQSAGTNGGKAFLVDGTSTAVTADLINALGAIRAAALTCSYGIPAAPEGKTLDFNQVNVVYGTKDNQSVLVKHSADCKDPSGWRYDDEAAPKQILLCDSVCGTVKGETVKTIDVVLGCATNGSVPGVN